VKIRVERRKGAGMETITLVPPITEIHDGERLSYFCCGDGTKHYFTPDGYYDGWGRAVNCSLEEAEKIIENVESDREREAEKDGSSG
jgi:hypothetical protein